MENSFQTSFIPKRPLMNNNGVSKSSTATSISMVVSVFILIVMIVASAGLYFYKDLLTKQQSDLSIMLNKIGDDFDSNTIENLEEYDKKTKAVYEILDNHIVFTPLFSLLNELTLPTIQYTNFTQTTTKELFSVKIIGIAKDYRSIALQADVFNTKKGNMFKDVVFSNLSKNNNNFIAFNLEFIVDRELLSYKNKDTNLIPKLEKNTVNNENPIEINEVVNTTKEDLTGEAVINNNTIQ